jgi:membrane-anchored protein YejM (alkaline phosphatase superfamily)
MENSRSRLLSAGAWFYLANVVFAVIISSRYLRYCAFDGNPFLIFYVGMAAFSHFASLVFISFILFYLPFVLFAPSQKASKVLMVALCSLSMMLLVLDTFIYDLYRFHINGFVLDMVFGGNFTQIFVFSPAVYLKSFFLLAVLVLIETLLAILVWKLFDGNKLKFGKFILLSIFGMLLCTHLIHAWAGAALYSPV